MILVVVLHDEAVRTLVLRNAARQLDACYLGCCRMRSSKQFLAFLAEGLGVDVKKRDTYRLWQSVTDRLSSHPRPIFLDNAELLTPSCMRTLVGLHKRDDHLGRGIPFVLASGERHLLEVLDAADESANIVSRCMFYAPGCQPTKRMRARAELCERIDSALVSPVISFPSIHDALQERAAGSEDDAGDA